MLKYPAIPRWWFSLILVGAFAMAQATNYAGKSGTPWWTLIIILFIAFIFTTVYAFLAGVLGFGQFVSGGTGLYQMLAAYMLPGDPVANMYAAMYGNNPQVQAIDLLQDLKLGVYLKIPPRHTFLAQMLGTVVGAILNYVMAISILTEQREVLLNISGNRVSANLVLANLCFHAADISPERPTDLVGSKRPILQLDCHLLGCPRTSDVRCRQALRSGPCLARNRSLVAHPLLPRLAIPPCPVEQDQDRFQEAQHCHYLPVLVLHVGRYQLECHALDGHWSLLAMVCEEEIPPSVHQVQREFEFVTHCFPITVADADTCPLCSTCWPEPWTVVPRLSPLFSTLPS